MNYVHRHCLFNVDRLIHQSSTPRPVYNINTPKYFLDISINTDYILTYRGIKEIQLIDQNNFKIKLKTKYSSKVNVLYSYYRIFESHLEAVVYFEQLRAFCLKRLQSQSEHLKQAALNLTLLQP